MNDKAVSTNLHRIKHTFKKYFPTYYFISSSEKFPYDGQCLILATLCERDPMIPNYLPN